jgi:transaldolase
MTNPLLGLAALGQSVWLDLVSRDLIETGELKRLIDEDGVRGVTSNPAIFEKAISGSKEYDAEITSLAMQGRNTPDIYEALTIGDIQMALDLFRPLFDRLNGGDGYVSLEVSPHLAYDTAGTVDEARRLWMKVNRPNLLIKVPGTKEGLPAVVQLIEGGISVNVTLLFGLPRYREVTLAYLDGLEAALAAGRPIERIASVASFFLSRIDVLADPKLTALVKAGGEQSQIAGRLVGELAIASAVQAYQVYKEVFGSERFQKLAARGAKPQRIVWASTSTKNPAYSDVKYVEPLVGPETINTLPMETVIAYRDHGQPAVRLEQDVAGAQQVLAELAALGLDIDQMTQQLEDEGVQKFIQPFDSLLGVLEQKRTAAIG